MSSYNKNKNNSRNREKNKDQAKFNKPRRYFCFTLVVCLVLFTLMFRIGYLQFVQGASLKEAAIKQQTTSRIISPSRGAIYDSKGKPLAITFQYTTKEGAKALSNDVNDFATLEGLTMHALSAKLRGEE